MAGIVCEALGVGKRKTRGDASAAPAKRAAPAAPAEAGFYCTNSPKLN